MKNVKFFRKALSLVLLATVSAASFVGCSSSSGASSAAAAPASSGAASAGSAASASGDKKVFRIALECAYAPFNWTQTDSSNNAVPIYDSNTYANGYDIQIAKKIADSMGATLEVHKTEWTAIPTAILSGKVDAGICGMTVTDERKKTLLFSEPYYYAGYVALVKKSGKYENAKSLDDLKGANCTSQQSTEWYKLLSQVKGVTLQPALADVPTMLVALTSGKTDVLSCDKPTGMAAVKAYPSIKMIEFADGKGFQYSKEEGQVCAALAKNNTELKTKIDTVLKGLSSEDREKLMTWAVNNQPST